MKKTAILIGILGVIVSIAGPVFSADAQSDRLAQQIRRAETMRQLEAAAPALAQFDAQLRQMTTTIAEQRRLQRRMEEQLRAHLTPQELVPLFFRQVTRQGFSEAIVEQTTLRKSSAALPNNDGGITGKVLVDGLPPGKDEVMVYAFDRHGYFCGASRVDEQTGTFAVTSLKSDSFYVFARSALYVDQLYDGISAPLGSKETWRQAKKVFVPNAVVSGIDFALNRGVTVSGSIVTSEGWAIDDGTFVDFTVTNDVDSTALLTREAEISGGRYSIVLPATGKFKIRAEVDGYVPTWAVDQTSWSKAQTVEVADLSASPVVDFKMTAVEPQPVGQITGVVQPALFVITAAFNAQNGAMVKFGLSAGLLEVPYVINDLPPGDYFVYVDDILGTLIGAGNSMGEFWNGADGQGARTIGGAKAVTVIADQPTEEINFTLETGTTVRGKMTDAGGAPLDSLTLLLVNAELLSASDDPFITRLELDLVAADFDGRYEIPGLKPGRYLLRTFSDFYINFDLGNTDSLLLDGKHKGKVVDQYYGGEPNLLRIARAERLVVNGEEELTVDWVLQPAHKIAGKVTDADGKPAGGLYVAALEDSSGYPFYPWATVNDSTGTYELRALPPGQYKLLALTGFSGNTELLSEFYGGGRSFYTAPVVDLHEPLLTNMNFTLEAGATIEGFVVDQDGKRLGADTVDRIPVAAYHAESGKVASYDFVQFNGGYRIRRLLPGAYKVATVPAVAAHTQLGVSYWGGGRSFDDVNSKEITLNYGETAVDKELFLKAASGKLTGFVVDSTGSAALSGVFVGAYDLSGHLAGYALTDLDALTGKKTGSLGKYEISGLAPGEYYVRTCALFMAVPLVTEATAFVGSLANFDVLGLLTGGNLGGFNISLPLYKDQWYNKVPASLTLSLDELLFQMSAYGLPNRNDYALTPIFLPLPFYDAVPSAAQKVLIDDKVAAVNFVLAKGGLNDLVTDIAQPAAPPTAFALHQNYPNPFNPGTKITFDLPRAAFVELTIYDALGRRVIDLTRRVYDAGSHSLIWNGAAEDGGNAAAGVYFARLHTGDFQKTIKLVLIK